MRHAGVMMTMCRRAVRRVTDGEAKELLVDALVRDARAVLDVIDVIDGQMLVGAARDAAELLG